MVTGFETPWVYLEQVPSDISEKDIEGILRCYGSVLDIRMPHRTGKFRKTFMGSVRIRFSTPSEALDAYLDLNGKKVFGTTITACRPMNQASTLVKNPRVNETSVRIRWTAPSQSVYCGYKSMEAAEKAMEAARVPFNDHFVDARIHTGLPAAGPVTVSFRGVPLGIDKVDMERFNYPDDVIWGQPNRYDLDEAINAIRRLLFRDRRSQPLDFLVLPPPYHYAATITAYAHYATVSDAKAACACINEKHMRVTGKARIRADHVRSLHFSISPEVLSTFGPDIRSFARAVRNCPRTRMTVVERPPPQRSYVRLSGDDVKELGFLKAEFEKIFNWEVLMIDSRIAWDPYFAYCAGQGFLDEVRKGNSRVIIENDVVRRMIRLRGCTEGRNHVRRRVVGKILRLRSQKLYTLELGAIAGIFLVRNLNELQRKLGEENISLDAYSRILKVRGDKTAFQTALEMVKHVRQNFQAPSRNHLSCPVCFDKPTASISLPQCGHKWCRVCMANYLKTSVENRSFPLICLGDGGKCKERVPLSTARRILSTPEYNTIVEVAFTTYVQARPNEFRYCPTPDCTQVYRPSSRRDDLILQCPACLLRICPYCHVEAHDGFDCPEADDPGGKLLQEWMSKNDVKPCPGCKVRIERAEGCNHVTCTRCKTHICWVCMQTFPGGHGIYDHMRSVHGGIGQEVLDAFEFIL